MRRYLETHGASRFQGVEFENTTVYNRAGFYRDKDGVRQYLVLPEMFRTEVVAGYKPAAACKVLIAAGLLQPGKDRVDGQRRACRVSVDRNGSTFSPPVRG